MDSLAGPCSNVVERCRGGASAPVVGSISAPARTAMVSSLMRLPRPTMGAAPRSGAMELVIVTLRLSLTTGLQTQKRGLVRQRRLHTPAEPNRFLPCGADLA